tara:strand:+ start:195 stop:632 length:438 start_codon:yes stop_codon:yes gene_type:complete
MTTTTDYSYEFQTPLSASEVLEILQDIPQWWSGFYNESISGTASQPGDEFSFSAGDGMHYSKQRLVELIPNQKITWLVVESNLSFLQDTQEWNNTQISFELKSNDKGTIVLFTHIGLTSEVECFDSCTDAWTNYLKKLKGQLANN